MRLLKALAAVVSVALFATGPAFAQTAQTQGAPGTQGTTSGEGTTSAPGGIPVGPITVYPGVNLAHGYDDNLFLRPAATSSSSFTIVSPYARAEARTGPHKFDFGLRIDSGRYHSSPADNYTDYAFVGTGDMVFSGRAGLKLRAEHRRGHDARGSTDRGISATPDEYDTTGISGIFRYGAPGARGRIEIDGAANTRSYINNRATTQFSDRDTMGVGGTFYWRIMPRIELLANASFTDINYKLATSTQDSTETRLLAGVKWEATAATTGIAKFGRQFKIFNSSSGRQDFEGSSWDVGVRWSPLTYSVFDFVTSKQTGESTGIGDTVVGTNFGATWSHAWSSRLRTQVFTSFRNDAFVGAGVTRKDDVTSFGLKVAYDFRRWLKLGAEYTHIERDSNDNAFNYKRNLLLFTVGATL